MNLHTTIEAAVMHVRFDCDGRAVNTITLDVLDELEDVLRQLEGDAGNTRAVIFSSAKAGSFITGADLFAMREMSEDESRAFIERGQRLLQRVAELPQTTVAAINGTCLGGGLELALACTYRVAADDGSIAIGLPEVKLGILPGWGGSTRLPRLIGLTGALPLLLTGRTLSPRKARSLGVIEEVVTAEALEHAARRLAKQPRRQRRASWREQAMGRLGPARNAILKRARAQTQATTYGNYPAPEEIIHVVEVGLRDGLQAGLDAERAALERLTKTDACQNLMRLFFLRQQSKKAWHDQLHAEPRPVHRAAVVGAGVMGSGIAAALITAGIDTRLVEIDAKQMSAGLRRIKQHLDAEVRAKRLSPVQAKRAMHRLSPALSFSGLSRVDLAIEAVVERPQVKADVLAKLDGQLPADAVIGSNTSSLNLTELAAGTERPQRVIGLHFFNPVAKMPLVEIVRTGHSEDAALATGLALGQRIGKTPVLVGDGPGFLVNRVLIPYLAEAIMLAAEGAPVDQVDRVMKQWGMPMGPFELLDQVGLDVSVDIFRSLGPRLGDHLPRVAAFEQVVDRGWLGKKSGRGFYHYPGSQWQRLHAWARRDRTHVNTDLVQLLRQREAHAGVVDEQTPWRLMLPMVNEAARVLEEGVTGSTDTIDLATVLGLGWAPFRGGLARWAESAGLGEIVRRMDALASEHGERFSPIPSLRRVAEAGEPLAAIAGDRSRDAATPAQGLSPSAGHDSLRK